MANSSIVHGVGLPRVGEKGMPSPPNASYARGYGVHPSQPPRPGLYAAI